MAGEGVGLGLGGLILGPIAGAVVRRTPLIGSLEIQAALRFVNQATLPCLVVQSLKRPLPDIPWGLTLSAFYGTKLIIAGLVWLVYRQQPKRQRLGTLALALATSPTLFAFPVLSVLLGGPATLAPAVVLGLGDNVLLNTVLFALLSRAGSPLPKTVSHEEGGSYSGELAGAHKHGLGVFTYASGARYRGEWRDNRKHGKGVYTFPSGAVYAGEMLQGHQTGLGGKRLSSGKLMGGRWVRGKLEAELPSEEWSTAVEAAQRAANAAEQLKHELGGFSVGAAVWQVLTSMSILVGGVALAHLFLRRDLPKTVVRATSRLSSIHAPLSLLVFGLCLGGAWVGCNDLVPAQRIRQPSGAALFPGEWIHIVMLTTLRTLPWLLSGTLVCLFAPQRHNETVAVLLAVGLSGLPPDMLPLCHRLRVEQKHVQALFGLGLQLSAFMVPLSVLGARQLPAAVLARSLSLVAGLAGSAALVAIFSLQKRTAAIGRAMNDAGGGTLEPPEATDYNQPSNPSALRMRMKSAPACTSTQARLSHPRDGRLHKTRFAGRTPYLPHGAGRRGGHQPISFGKVMTPALYA